MDSTSLNLRLLIPRVGTISPAFANEGERRPGGCGAALIMEGMNRGGERGWSGGRDRVLVGSKRAMRVMIAVTKLCQNPDRCNRTVPKPYLLTLKGMPFERKQNPRNGVKEWKEKKLWIQ